jgi:ribonucleoside-diphosphate reductase alpha chain
MNSSISERIWDSKYRFARDSKSAETDIGETWSRVARAVASAEASTDQWQAKYESILSDFLFLPGGRVLAGAGTGKQVTLFNCFVSGPLLDSVESIFDSLKETAVTMQQGGGIGLDFSGLRPSGAPAVRTGSVASGPLPFMHIWDSLCKTLLATSSRRGAMMGTLRCDHPDIAAFIDSKREHDALQNFNLSVLITDDFMQAVADDSEWQLVYPADDGQVYERLPARALWQRIIRAAHETAEPGMLFIDNINRRNNLYYCERIGATNPCGEVPLPPYGACNLGSINLAALVQAPLSRDARFDQRRLRETVKVAVRFLDDVIDVSRFPLDQQGVQARSTRRIGLGITGLADALAMLGFHYDSDAAREFAANTMEIIRDTAYGTSISLASEKGTFPCFDKDRFLDAPFIQRLPDHLRRGISENGIRNSHLLAIAPAGTISLLAGNISSGIEPIYALEATRAVRDSELRIQLLDVRDYAYDLWLNEDHPDEPPEVFVTAEQLPAKAQLQMQECLQPLVDSAISKTVNLPPEATIDDVDEIFSYAYSAGLKGCTIFRPGTRSGQVLRARNDSHCCHANREPD